MGACFVCGAEAVHDHHVVPRSVLPNNATVPLCDRCHSLVPGHPSSLIRGQSLSWAMREQKRRAVGLQVGGTARFGFRWVNGSVVEDSREQECRALMFRLFDEGVGFEGIAAGLNEAGFSRRGGAPWTSHTVNKRCVEAGRYRRHPYRRKEAA